jgi:hypothetical protein
VSSSLDRSALSSPAAESPLTWINLAGFPARPPGSLTFVKFNPAPISTFTGVTDRLEFREMSTLKIPHNALVFVGDGRKTLFLRNEGESTTLSTGRRSTRAT